MLGRFSADEKTGRKVSRNLPTVKGRDLFALSSWQGPNRIHGRGLQNAGPEMGLFQSRQRTFFVRLSLVFLLALAFRFNPVAV